jgi:hypothetical protein
MSLLHGILFVAPFLFCIHHIKVKEKSGAISALDKNFERTLRAYKYVAPSDSVLEKLFLHRMWNFLAALVPRSIAPNLITLTGGVFIICAAVGRL